MQTDQKVVNWRWHRWAQEDIFQCNTSDILHVLREKIRHDRWCLLQLIMQHRYLPGMMWRPLGLDRPLISRYRTNAFVYEIWDWLYDGSVQQESGIWWRINLSGTSCFCDVHWRREIISLKWNLQFLIWKIDNIGLGVIVLKSFLIVRSTLWGAFQSAYTYTDPKIDDWQWQRRR